jgi:hypothetical protein
MPHFGWTRLAYLLFVLVVLTTLVQLASLGTDPRPLASEPRESVREPREPAKTAQPVSAALPASVEDNLEDLATSVPAAAAPHAAPQAPEPVFERPAPAAQPAGSDVAAVRAPAYSSGPVCGNLENFPRTSKIFFPLPKAYFDTYEDTWGRLGRRVATRGQI